VSTLCKICEKKRARRSCPGVGGEICPTCCGTEREITVDCPSDCEFLIEARLREKPPELTAEQIPNLDIKLDEDFLRQHEELVLTLSLAFTRAMVNEKAVDQDAREALDALIRTYRTLDSGLIYESRPQNPYAAALTDALKSAAEELAKATAEREGMQTLRDADVLGTLVFLQRLELQHANGRRRGRAFLDFLRAYFPAEQPAAANIAL
jgi:hypothetical protein